MMWYSSNVDVIGFTSQIDTTQDNKHLPLQRPADIDFSMLPVFYYAFFNPLLSLYNFCD